MCNEVKLMERCCCFTGHRPEKLTDSEKEVCKSLEKEIRQAIANGLTVFISGMARGIDIWAAEIVLRLRYVGEPVRLICASPFEGVERSWSGEWQRQYKTIMNATDCVRFICPAYSHSCFQIGNEWMVDHSVRVIAVYNGEPGGTRNTVEYAKQKHICSVILSAV